jgi:hypothetical protein
MTLKRVALVLLILLGLAGGGASAQPESGATGYNVGLRPDRENGPTPVEIGIYVLDLMSINDVKQEFTADLYVNARWRDPRLATTSGEGERVLPAAEVWQPAFGILNRRGIDLLLPDRVRVDAEGNVAYTQRVLGQFASRMDLRQFPADDQRLSVQLVSYRYGPDEVEVRVDTARTGRLETMSVSGWQIGTPELDPSPLEVPGNVRAGATLRLGAQRETTYYLLTMALPLLLIALMAWTVFWIDPANFPPQVSVATASVFSLIAFRFSLSTQLPKVSYLTAADWFILIMTLLVFGALGEAIVTGRLARIERGELARRMDAVGRWVYLAVLVLVCVIALA